MARFNIMAQVGSLAADIAKNPGWRKLQMCADRVVSTGEVQLRWSHGHACGRLRWSAGTADSIHPQDFGAALMASRRDNDPEFVRFERDSEIEIHPKMEYA